MELKTKYQYTYFIYPYEIEEKQYEKYILKLLSNSKCRLKIYEEEKNIDIYSYFLEDTKKFFFPSFYYDKQKIKKIQKQSPKEKAKMLSKESCITIEYNIGQNVQGKMGEQNGIFFKIDKIEIICFSTGICFLCIKTHLEDSENFGDILNFNYKFRDINLGSFNLKEYDNIKIQTDIFNDMTEIKELISEIIGNRREMGRFYTYSYACIDSENWNNEIENIETDFLKYSYVLPNSYDARFNDQNRLRVISERKYVKMGITKQSSCLLASNIDTINYTKLPFSYENKYLYTKIIALYQKEYLKKTIKELKSGKLANKLNEFSKFVWQEEVTTDSTGELLYKNWLEELEIEKIYTDTRNNFDVLYRKLNIEKNKKANKILVCILGISLILNIVNLLTIILLCK